MPTTGYEVVKIFNNNVLLAKHQGTEKILIKKGIGFSWKITDLIPEETSFEKIFSIESSETSHKFNQLLTAVDPHLVGVCEEILCFISSKIDSTITEEMHIRLIDHIAFTIYRLQHHDTIENPFIVEIETLYSQEYEIARQAVRLLEKSVAMAIPDSEIGFITLHIHTLRSNGKLSSTIKNAYICNSVLELIEDELRIEVDRKSIDYARFVCHIRFAAERITQNIPIRNDLLMSIRKTYKNSYKLAQKVSQFMEEELALNVPETETGFIAMHIERLKNASSYGSFYVDK